MEILSNYGLIPFQVQIGERENVSLPVQPKSEESVLLDTWVMSPS